MEKTKRNNHVNHSHHKVIQGQSVHKNMEQIGKPILHNDVLVTLQGHKEDHWSGISALMMKDLLCLEKRRMTSSKRRQSSSPSQSPSPAQEERIMIEEEEYQRARRRSPSPSNSPSSSDSSDAARSEEERGPRHTCRRRSTHNVLGVEHKSSKKEERTSLFSHMMVPTTKMIRY